MSCGCSSSGSCNTCNPCCLPVPTCDATAEALASQLNNLLTFLIGTITKSCNDDDEVIWSLPCDLDGNEPITGFPKETGESILCYLLRVALAISTSSGSTATSLSALTAVVNGLKIRALHGFIEVPINKTYVLMASAEINSTIDNIRIGTLSGTCTVAIQINGVSVTGLGAIAVTATEQTVNATALRTLVVGNRLTMVVTATSSTADLEFSLLYTA